MDITRGRVRSQKLWEQGLSGDPHHAKSLRTADLQKTTPELQLSVDKETLSSVMLETL